MAEEEFLGWPNWETWNVALWLTSDYVLYRVMGGFRTYQQPFLSLRRELQDSVQFRRTKDGVSLWDARLDIAALDEMIKES